MKPIACAYCKCPNRAVWQVKSRTANARPWYYCQFHRLVAAVACKRFGLVGGVARELTVNK